MDKMSEQLQDQIKRLKEKMMKSGWIGGEFVQRDGEFTFFVPNNQTEYETDYGHWEYLCAAANACPALLKHIESQAKEIERLPRPTTNEGGIDGLD